MAKRQGDGVILTDVTSKGLNTFGGVFTPSILTILGVIMYLRFGWVVGHVGLWQTLLIVTISTSITFLTGLSISAIATDQVVKAGGAYYMISRSLGIETGGSRWHTPLFCPGIVSSAVYPGFCRKPGAGISKPESNSDCRHYDGIGHRVGAAVSGNCHQSPVFHHGGYRRFLSLPGAWPQCRAEYCSPCRNARFSRVLGGAGSIFFRR